MHLNSFSNVQNMLKKQNYSRNKNFKNEFGLHKPPSAANFCVCLNTISDDYFVHLENFLSRCHHIVYSLDYS